MLALLIWSGTVNCWSGGWFRETRGGDGSTTPARHHNAGFGIRWGHSPLRCGLRGSCATRPAGAPALERHSAGSRTSGSPMTPRVGGLGRRGRDRRRGHRGSQRGQMGTAGAHRAREWVPEPDETRLRRVTPAAEAVHRRPTPVRRAAAVLAAIVGLVVVSDRRSADLLGAQAPWAREGLRPWGARTGLETKGPTSADMPAMKANIPPPGQDREF